MIWVIAAIIAGVLIYDWFTSPHIGRQPTSPEKNNTADGNKVPARTDYLPENYKFESFDDIYNKLSYFINDILDHNRNR